MPNDPPAGYPALRYAAGEAWDELGGLPDDLDAWVLCPKCAMAAATLLLLQIPRHQRPIRAFHPGWWLRNLNYWGGKVALAGAGGCTARLPRRRSVTQPEYWHHRVSARTAWLPGGWRLLVRGRRVCEVADGTFANFNFRF